MSNDKISVERTSRDDVKDIVAIAQRIASFTEEEVACLCTDLDENFAEATAQDQMLTLKIGGRVVGFCHFGPLPITDRTWMMYWILVDPAEQAHGLGQQIMAEMEKRISAENGRMILIETSDDDGFARSRRFYERAGYETSAIIPHFYGSNLSKCVFAKIN